MTLKSRKKLFSSLSRGEFWQPVITPEAWKELLSLVSYSPTPHPTLYKERTRRPTFFRPARMFQARGFRIRVRKVRSLPYGAALPLQHTYREEACCTHTI